MLSHCDCSPHLGGQVGGHHAWLVIFSDKEGISRVCGFLRHSGAGWKGALTPSLELTCSSSRPAVFLVPEETVGQDVCRTGQGV